MEKLSVEKIACLYLLLIVGLFINIGELAVFIESCKYWPKLTSAVNLVNLLGPTSLNGEFKYTTSYAWIYKIYEIIRFESPTVGRQ